MAVTGLPGDITYEELDTVFTTYGQVSRVKILKTTRLRTAFASDAKAFVCYAKRKSAQDAIKVLDKSYKIRKREEHPIRVTWAQSCEAETSSYSEYEESGSEDDSRGSEYSYSASTASEKDVSSSTRSSKVRTSFRDFGSKRRRVGSPVGRAKEGRRHGHRRRSPGDKGYGCPALAKGGKEKEQCKSYGVAGSRCSPPCSKTNDGPVCVETRRVYVSGLPGTTTETDVQSRFGECGVLQGFQILRRQGRPNGQVHVIVRYKEPASAEKALKTRWGSNIKVSPAKPNARWGEP